MAIGPDLALPVLRQKEQPVGQWWHQVAHARWRTVTVEQGAQALQRGAGEGVLQRFAATLPGLQVGQAGLVKTAVHESLNGCIEMLAL